MKSRWFLFLAVALGLSLPAMCRAGMAPTFLLKWDNNGKLGAVMGIAVDRSGNVYVADTKSDYIHKFDGMGSLLMDLKCSQPVGVAVSSSGLVYVTSQGTRMVHQFDNGKEVRAWGKFESPMGVAVDGDGFVYVADNKAQVQKFTAEGKYISMLKVSNPTGIAVDAMGNVFVSSGNFRIEKFDGFGNPLGGWGTLGTDPGQLTLPSGVATDADGNVYVAERKYSRIQKFSGSGDYLTQWGSNGRNDGEFADPWGVAVGSDGSIFVTDTGNLRVQKFAVLCALTAIGSNVPVEFKPAGISFTFDQVAQEGTTCLGMPAKAPAPPGGYFAGIGPQNYSASTTALYTGFVHVCINYSDKWFKEGDKALAIFQMVDGVWVNQTTGHDEEMNVICGTVMPLGVFALFTATPPYGSVIGHVLAGCPAPETPLLGVTVDVYEAGRPDLVESAVTDEAGYYRVNMLPATFGIKYTVHVVTPLGYSTPIEAVSVAFKGGPVPKEPAPAPVAPPVPQSDIATVDFPMDCVILPYEPRSIGYWKHQFAVATGGKGKAQVDPATLCGYLDMIVNHFNSNAVNSVIVYQPPSWGGNAEKLQLASDLLNLKGSVEMIVRARQQLIALLLNVASGGINLTREVSKDGATLSQAITYCDQLIDDPAGNHERAKTIADDINNGKKVAAGVIPLDTQNIAYRRGDAAADLMVRPNPLRTSARVAYTVPAGGRPVQLALYDVAGRRVQSLISGLQRAGRHEMDWTANVRGGNRTGAGVYFLRLTVGETVSIRRVAILP